MQRTPSNFLKIFMVGNTVSYQNATNRLAVISCQKDLWPDQTRPDQCQYGNYKSVAEIHLRWIDWSAYIIIRTVRKSVSESRTGVRDGWPMVPWSK